MGKRHYRLRQAAQYLSQQVGSIAAVSAVYETAPWGNTQQAAFLNQALWLNTTLSPHEVLAAALRIEQQMGRVRLEKWGQRIIDIDLLLYDDVVVQHSDLILPHPLLHERRFALQPLCDIAPNLSHPLLHRTCAQLLAHCRDTSEVRRWQ